MRGKVRFVSIGPGDPELMTIKALRYLNESDIIYLPKTINTFGITRSRSAEILCSVGIDKNKITAYELPMNANRNGALIVYNSLLRVIMDDIDLGKTVAIVAEGDGGLYSSIHYIYERLLEYSVSIEKIPGIPAFIAAGAIAGIHIAELDQKLIIIPGNTDYLEIKKHINDGNSVVLMKISRLDDKTKLSLKNDDLIACHYFENLGYDNQVYHSNKGDIFFKPFPYFSLLLLQPIVNT